MTFLDYIHTRGFTSYSLAKTTGISVRSIENYTNRGYKLRNARAWMFLAIAEALGVEPQEFLWLAENDFETE